MKRRAYHRAYYWANVERRREYARRRRQARRWCAWLIREVLA